MLLLISIKCKAHQTLNVEENEVCQHLLFQRHKRKKQISAFDEKSTRPLVRIFPNLSVSW